MGAQCYRCDQSPDHFALTHVIGGDLKKPCHPSVDVCLQEALAQHEVTASAALRAESKVRKYERALEAVLSEADRMKDECTDPPCKHAEGMRLAVNDIRSRLE